MTKFRTNTCGELRATNVGNQVKLGGWVHSIRDHGSLLFIDLRDNYGITQCVIDVEKDKNLVDLASKITLESVILVEGKVVARAKETTNPNLPTGEIEVDLDKLEIESRSEQIPFQIADENQNYPEDLRLKYRFLDLRTKKMHRNIQMRSKVIDFMREEMKKQDFLEFQTPILTSSSPEGARDFLVPSRNFPGKFYALPQAPQQFKQLLMISGFDKYFQIAPCFRDEGTRADRLLYFYQLDMEMSFVEQEDVWNVMEPVMQNIFRHFRPERKITNSPIARIKYWDSMLKYGCDKPDLRNPIEIVDTTSVFRSSDFGIFAKAIENNPKVVVRGIPAKNTSEKPRSFFDKMVEYAIEEGAKGLGYITWTKEGEAKGPVAKFLNPERLEELKKTAKLENGDTIFFSCGSVLEASKLAGKVRTKLGNELGLIDKEAYAFCWIIDFPFFEMNEETGALDFAHNPFSMPQGGLEALENTKDPYDIIAYQYDFVCNGYEMCSGGVRNHKIEIMYKAFEMVGYSKEEVDNKFGGMISAFKFGAPPHAGTGFGIDRIVMLLLDEENLRQVTAFPTNGKGEDLMMNAPNNIDEIQLRELHIKLRDKI
ncbi:MAG TPA: aspartate--tRNA ligase [Rickettsiales bacterium]|nr:aspartate--tRNA ligase [Rickettsiales bacterium]